MWYELSKKHFCENKIHGQLSNHQPPTLLRWKNRSLSGWLSLSGCRLAKHITSDGCQPDVDGLVSQNLAIHSKNTSPFLFVCSPVRGVENFVVEHREVERKAESDWVSGRELCMSYVTRCFVCLQAVLSRLFPVIAGGKLGLVSVIITLPVKETKIVQHLFA